MRGHHVGVQDHNKTFQIVLAGESFRELYSAQFLPHSFSGLLQPFLRAVPPVYMSVFLGGEVGIQFTSEAIF